MAELKDIFTFLEKQENGADLIATLNKELNSLRTESAGYRTKYNGIATALGIKDREDAESALAGITKTLEAIAAGGNKPDAVGTQLADLAKKVQELTEKATAEEERAKTEHQKRISEAKLNKALAALSKNGASAPGEIAKILLANIEAKEDDSLVFKMGDKELDVEEGTKGWLEANPWAKANPQPGGAGSTGGKAGVTDYDNMSMEQFAEAFKKREQK